MKYNSIKTLLRVCSVGCCITATITTTLTTSVFLASCNDITTYGNDDYIAPENRPNTGAPEILGIYDVTDVIYDNPLTSITPNQRIRVRGKNLNHVKSISFNSFEANLEQVGAASDYCVVTVPETFDIVQTKGIQYTTDMGTGSADIIITPLPLVMKGLANTFAEPGTTAAVSGAYFKAYHFGDAERTSVVLNGDTPLEVKDVTSDGMNIVLPDDAPDNSIISFNWTDAEGVAQSFSNHYRPTSYRCFETLNLTAGDSFNDQEGYNLSVQIEEDGAEGIPSLGSQIVRFSGKAKQWGWYSANIDSELKTPYAIAGQNDYDPSLTRGYCFEFEVMTLAPMPSSADADKNGVMFSIEWGETYEWSPSETNEEFDTQGEWVTVRLPLNEVATKGLRPVSWGGTTHFGIIISPIVDQAEYNLRLSNFRIVKDLNPDEEEIIEPEPGPEPEPEPETPTTEPTVLYDAQTVIATDWSTSIKLEATAFASAQEGDIVTVFVSSVLDGAQIKLSNPTGSWEALDSSVDCIALTAADTQFTMTITADILAKLQANGMAIQGHSYTVDQVTLTPASSAE